MPVVINVSEARFRDIQRIAEVQLESNHFKTAEQIIANGTPLPKGHGRLIDADELNEQEIPAIKKDDVVYVKLSTLQDLIDNAPTIIEAESEE